jgi:NAD(P)-dependent dehydrogenase (short-subunit alcohol dehydrogenase family)
MLVSHFWSLQVLQLLNHIKILDLNVLAPIILIGSLRAKLQKSTIISISSVSDKIAESDSVLYCSSKAANTRHFESLAKELQQAKVYTLLPDYVDTPMLRELQSDNDFNWMEALRSKDIANICLELTERAIAAPSGSNIIVVNDALKDDPQSVESLFGYNTDTKTISKLK